MRYARRLIIGGIVAAALLSASNGFAASQPTGSNNLGWGTSSVSRCDTDGLGIVHNLSGSNVASVTISGIASGCGNASLSVNVNNGSANSSGSGTVPAGGGSMTVSLSAGVAADD